MVSSVKGLVPDGFIYLRATPETCMRRMGLRQGLLPSAAAGSCVCAWSSQSAYLCGLGLPANLLPTCRQAQAHW